jgi:hypothetical protein
MSVKKLNLEKALEREHCEPKLKGRQTAKLPMENTDWEKINNFQPYEVRLKTKSDVENIKPDVKNVELGMTQDEVIKVAGSPHYIIEWYTGNLKYNYRNLWVVIENGAVTCLVRSKDFEEYWGRSDYERENPKAIIK